MPSVTIFSIATGRYLDFWKSMVTSAIDNELDFSKINFFVLTDQIDSIPPNIQIVLGESLRIFFCEHREWPYPTLLRYKYLKGIGNEVKTDYIMHLDADMFFVKTLNIGNLVNDLGEKDIAVVKHPGFFRPRSIQRLTFYANHPSFLIRDAVTTFKFGGLGTWETKKTSTARVPRRRRKGYACGGAWFGKTNSILAMCETLENNIDLDLQNGIIAKFHDESHLNAFVSQSKSVTWLNPEYCFEPSYPQLNHLDPFLRVIDKNVNEKWER